MFFCWFYKKQSKKRRVKREMADQSWQSKKTSTPHFCHSVPEIFLIHNISNFIRFKRLLPYPNFPIGKRLEPWWGWSTYLINIGKSFEPWWHLGFHLSITPSFWTPPISFVFFGRIQTSSYISLVSYRISLCSSAFASYYTNRDGIGFHLIIRDLRG
jgi:hypothetical protein